MWPPPPGKLHPLGLTCTTALATSSALQALRAYSLEILRLKCWSHAKVRRAQGHLTMLETPKRVTHNFAGHTLPRVDCKVNTTCKSVTHNFAGGFALLTSVVRKLRIKCWLVTHSSGRLGGEFYSKLTCTRAAYHSVLVLDVKSGTQWHTHTLLSREKLVASLQPQRESACYQPLALYALRKPSKA